MGFIEDLEQANQEHLRKIDAIRDPAAAIADRPEVVRRLKLALRQELEAAEIAALWMSSTRPIDIKLSLGKLCGDESKHFRLITKRLEELGETVDLDALMDGRSKLYDYFTTLTDAVERISAASFTRESIGYVRNEQFIDFCTQAGDAVTANLYRQQIQPDEKAHVEIGRTLLLKYAVSAEDQARARAAAEKTLALAEGAVTMLVTTQRMSQAPGC